VTVQDPNTGRYVNTDPNGVKRGDQNFAAIGPARLSSEEETQQQIDKGIPPANIVNIDLGEVTQGASVFGEFHPSFWYTQQQLGTAVGDGVVNKFYANSLLVTVENTLSNFNFYLYANGNQPAMVGNPYVQIQFAVYSSLYGLPYVKLYESSIYDLATISTGTYTTVPVDILLPPGKYWIVIANGGGSPPAGTPPSLRTRQTMTFSTSYVGQATDDPTPTVTSTTISLTTLIFSTLYQAGSLPETIDFTDSAVRADCSGTTAFWDIYMNFGQ
jgi:hypothetical protein